MSELDFKSGGAHPVRPKKGRNSSTFPSPVNVTGNPAWKLNPHDVRLCSVGAKRCAGAACVINLL